MNQQTTSSTTHGGITQALVAVGRWLWAFACYLKLRFEADRCTRAAASLAYTSLLAVVPLMTVVFVTLSAFPAFQGWRESIESFVFQNFVPALGDQVQSYLVQFADKAKGLQAAGVAVLLVTVLTMMATIESTFNVIWGIKRKRPLVVRFLVYWSVLTLGPILIGAGMVATSYVISLPLLADAGVTGTLKTKLITAFPIVATTTAFVLFFKLIPYRPVPFKHALVGGVVASVLFELAKRGFGFYVTHFPSQQAVYGAFATVPIFLIWIYLSWVVVLLGAEITQCLTTFRGPAAKAPGNSDEQDPMRCAYRVLLRLYEAQMRGHGLSEKDLMRLEANFGYQAINHALEQLDKAGWISRNDLFQWVLMRDLNRTRLIDLIRLIPSFSAQTNVHTMRPARSDTALENKLTDLQQWSEKSLAVSLATLMLNEDHGPESAGTNLNIND